VDLDNETSTRDDSGDHDESITPITVKALQTLVRETKKDKEDLRNRGVVQSFFDFTGGEEIDDTDVQELDDDDGMFLDLDVLEREVQKTVNDAVNKEVSRILKERGLE